MAPIAYPNYEKVTDNFEANFSPNDDLGYDYIEDSVEDAVYTFVYASSTINTAFINPIQIIHYISKIPKRETPDTDGIPNFAPFNLPISIVIYFTCIISTILKHLYFL